MNGATVLWREGVSPSVACRKARLFPSAHFQKETRLAARLEGDTPPSEGPSKFNRLLAVHGTYVPPSSPASS